MSVGYVIRFCPYMWEEGSNGMWYHRHYNQITEFFDDEIGYRERISELENSYFEDLDGSVYDGVDIDDVFVCEMRRIRL